jgi:hypothetical protein
MAILWLSASVCLVCYQRGPDLPRVPLVSGSRRSKLSHARWRVGWADTASDWRISMTLRRALIKAASRTQSCRPAMGPESVAGRRTRSIAGLQPSSPKLGRPCRGRGVQVSKRRNCRSLTTRAEIGSDGRTRSPLGIEIRRSSPFEAAAASASSRVVLLERGD